MIKVRDIAYVCFGVTDLHVAKEFLTDFGLDISYESASEVAFSTANGNPYAYVAYQADKNSFLGFGLEARDANDLDILVSAGLATLSKPLVSCFGGRRASLRHPDGHNIDIVHGRKWQKKKETRAPLIHNYGTSKQRVNKSQRPPKGSVAVLRPGHIALTVSNAEDSAAWFRETLGLLPADYLMTPGEKPRVVGVFMSCDPENDITDHHSVFVSESDETKFHHIGFEVQDIDAVMSGHDFLIKKGYSIEVGVGRHMAGSQVFDYWIDPFGHRIEHYSDGDVVDVNHSPSKIVGTPEGVTQWGPIPPDKFFQ